MKRLHIFIVVLIIVIIVTIIWNQMLIPSKEKVSEKTMNFLNKNLVAPNTEAKLVSISEVSGIYNVTFSYQNQTMFVFVTKDGSFIFFSPPLAIEENITKPELPEETIGNFVIDKNEVCKENGKPIVYFFGSQTCQFCTWEEAVIKNVTEKFKDVISFHENVDTDADKDIILKYDPKLYIPLVVIGCKYYRVGSGEIFGETEESRILTALICSLTNNKPLSVCIEAEDLINQME